MQNIRRCLLLILLFIVGQKVFSQTYQSEDNGRDGLVVAYDISYSFEKRAMSYLAISLICTPKSINKITYLGKVYSSSDFPASIIQSLMTGVSTTRPNVHFDVYNGGTFLTKWSSRVHSFTIDWSRVFNHQSTGDWKTNDAAIQQLNKQGQAMVDAGGLRLNIASIDNVLFDRMIIDNFLRENKKAVETSSSSGTQGKTELSVAGGDTKIQNNNNYKKTNNNTGADDSFWSDKSPSKTTNTSTAGNVVPDQAIHKNLPDFVRTTDGGYFQRGADGKFRQVSAEEYQQAKKQVADSKAQAQKEPEQPKITAEEFGAQAAKKFSDQVAQNNAIYENIDRKFDMYKQNFYYAQAIQSGKENLSGLSRLEGNYSSVQELEAEFNQKYYSIRGEVNNIEQARNSQLNNAVNSTFNGNSTEQAIGQSLQLFGNMINSAQAAKERKEAQAALKLERDQQLAAMAAAKTRARIELRTKLIQSFPNGGTPLSSHKVTLPEVYVFAYVNDKATINNEQALVSLSNVFPVQQYSDGTYPYKTTVLNKLKGYAPGEITLVGYYGDKTRAEEMRNAFINLAAKSELAVKPFTVKTVPGSTSPGAKSGISDFWETGKKPATKPNDTQEAEKKKDPFWDN